MERLLASEPCSSISDYLDAGGGKGLLRARDLGPDLAVELVRQAGLRGRGGGGFSTGFKWRGTADAPGPRALVVNAAEGEPGTLKDRTIMMRNPYLLIEGAAIAAFSVGADFVYLGIKAKFTDAIERVSEAVTEMTELLGELEIRIVEGPDDYLFGVETAMLEVIEGKDALPRVLPPYLQGIRDTAGVEYATMVNNVETLANVPGILAHGPDWYREVGTHKSPGTMVFTVSGDVETPAVAELPMGTPLSYLIYGVGGGIRGGRAAKLVISGVSNRPLTSKEMDTPLSFEAMSAIGSGLGAGGFIVYDESTCVAEVGASLSTFLQRGSCGQCPPCKLGTTEFMNGFARMVDGESSVEEIERLIAWLSRVTDANRCGLGAGQRELASGLLATFTDDLFACIAGSCSGHRGLVAPDPTDHDPTERRAIVFVSE